MNMKSELNSVRRMLNITPISAMQNSLLEEAELSVLTHLTPAFLCDFFYFRETNCCSVTKPSGD